MSAMERLGSGFMMTSALPALMSLTQPDRSLMYLVVTVCFGM
jgi:hypothetical protein